MHFGCGRYYFSAIDVASTLTIVAQGNVDLFVDGDVRVAGPLRVDPGGEGRVTLYVNGQFAPTNSVTLGEAAEADAFRLYVRDQVRLAGPFVMNGSLFAPGADFIASNTVTLRGGLFANRIDLAAPVEIRNGPRYTADACLVWDELDDQVDVE